MSTFWRYFNIGDKDLLYDLYCYDTNNLIKHLKTRLSTESANTTSQCIDEA